ncbi:MAG: hypothetical protein DMG13_32780 [Acidobacteria bacterium]|nr:MAG: hypothetical protein DMG13_32780 [Acidobacteriota bacterium]
MSADNPAGATLSTVREAQARQRAASKNAKRKRDSAQPQKTRSASATARSLKKIDRRYSSPVRVIRGQKNKKLRICYTKPRRHKERPG